jgi:hypothetical protein
MLSDLSKRDLAAFDLENLKNYLKKSDWTQVDEAGRTCIFKGPTSDTGRPILLPIPRFADNTDYDQRILDALRVLSVIENVGLKTLIQNIATISNDILRMRVINPGEYKNSIPLDVAATEIDALKKMFLFGATAEATPRPYFDLPNTIGKNHVKRCQFGHTFEGSFGFTINSPIVADFSQLPLFEEAKEIPFERRVMERIISGFENVKKTIETRETKHIVDNFETGLNSRMCEAIVELSMENTKEIEFSLDWSYSLKPNRDLSSFVKIQLKPENYDLVKEAADQLKSVEPFNDIIIGPIVTLHSNKQPFIDENFKRTAVIKHLFEGRKIDVTLELDRSGYEVAYEAHGAGKTVRAVGKIFRKGVQWRMIDIKSISIFHQ